MKAATKRITEAAKPVWPADNVERRPIDELVPSAHNARRHSAAQIGQVAVAIREFGWTMPVLIDEAGGIIAGHGRVLAAQQLGIKDVPVIVARGWNDAQKRAYALADNKLTDNSEWDDDTLRAELEMLKNSELGIGITGFTDDEFDALIAKAVGDGRGQGDPDHIPEAPENPISRRGDIWELGRHRLLCGDSTLRTEVERLRDGAAVDLILTDPPYCSGGFQESGRAGGSVGTDAPHKQIANDRLSSRGFQALLKAAFEAVEAPYLYAFTDWRMWVWLFDVAESSGFGVRSMIVWDKGTPGMGRGWRSQHELVLFAAKSVPPFDKHASGAGNVLSYARTGNIHHTTEKPAELIGALLKVAEFAKVIVDPFVGSGTTIIAAEMTGRSCYAIEIDPAYVDVAVNRWQKFTGHAARLQDDGADFDAIAARRRGEEPAK